MRRALNCAAFASTFRTGQNMGKPIPLSVFLNGPTAGDEGAFGALGLAGALGLVSTDGADPSTGAGESCALPAGSAVKVLLLRLFCLTFITDY